jgi:hypothetical protein
MEPFVSDGYKFDFDQLKSIEIGGYVGLGKLSDNIYESIIFDEKLYIKACGIYGGRVRMALRLFRLNDILK